MKSYCSFDSMEEVREHLHGLSEESFRLIGLYRDGIDGGLTPDGIVDALIDGIGYDAAMGAIAAMTLVCDLWYDDIGLMNLMWAMNASRFSGKDLYELGFYYHADILPEHMNMIADAAREKAERATA